jgi:hypothetical protein
VLGLGWLRNYHRRPGTTGFGLTHCWDSPPLVCPPAPDGLGVGSFVASPFTTRSPRTTWFQPAPSFSCSGEGLTGANLGAGRPEETPSFWPLSPCARVAAAALASFHLLQPRQLAVWLPPQLQHLSCYFEVAHVPGGCASPQATHVGA